MSIAAIAQSNGDKGREMTEFTWFDPTDLDTYLKVVQRRIDASNDGSPMPLEGPEPPPPPGSRRVSVYDYSAARMEPSDGCH